MADREHLILLYLDLFLLVYVIVIIVRPIVKQFFEGYNLAAPPVFLQVDSVPPEGGSLFQLIFKWIRLVVSDVGLNGLQVVFIGGMIT